VPRNGNPARVAVDAAVGKFDSIRDCPVDHKPKISHSIGHNLGLFCSTESDAPQGCGIATGMADRQNQIAMPCPIPSKRFMGVLALAKTMRESDNR